MAKHVTDNGEMEWLSKKKGIVTYSAQEVLSHVQFLQLVVASYKFEGEDLDYLVAKISDLKRDVASHLDHLKHYIEDKNVPFRSK